MMDTDVYNHYLSGMTPTEIAEHLKEFFPEFGDLEVEEVLLRQESALSYIQSNRHYSALDESESSHGATSEQLALDEAIARSLELGDDFNHLCISEHGGRALVLGGQGVNDEVLGGQGVNDDYKGAKRHQENEGSSFQETHTRGAGEHLRQDDIDPDRMTYEELQSLGESVGSESKGLPADLISQLPSFKYKVGGFSKIKRNEKEECVICYSEYKNGVQLTSLPCAHNYHSDCISRWLEDSKNCPVCQKEVQADSFSA